MIVACARMMSPTPMTARCNAPAGAGEPMRHEVLLQFGEPAAGRRFEQRDLWGDDRRVKLLAFRKERLDRGSADRAAEVAHHVEEARSGTGLRRRDPDHCDRGDRVNKIAWPSARITSGQNSWG